jgi:hypothetical protein
VEEKMAEKKKEKEKTKDQGMHQTDLAEGEPETVDESIKIHERKKDQQGSISGKEEKAA